MLRRAVFAAGLTALLPVAFALRASEAQTPPATGSSPTEAFVIGRMLVLEGDFGSARELLDRAAAAAPRDPYLRLELAGLALRMGRIDDATREARQALALAPDDPDVLRSAAEALLAVSDGDARLLEEARVALEKLLTLREEDPDALQALARLYSSAGERTRAEQMLRRLAAAAPDARQVTNQLLHLLLERGAKGEAAALLREQLARDPEALEVRLGLADLLSDTGDHANSVKVLREAPGDQAKQGDVLRRLAFELYRSGDVPAANALVDSLLAAGPDARLRLFRALLLEEQGKDDEALKELEILHGEIPADPEVGLSLARMLARGDKREEARAMLKELIADLSGGGPERRAVADRARLELAQLLAEEERWGEVVPILDDLDGRQPATRAAATLLRVDALVGLDRKDEALAQLEPAAGLPPQALAAKRAEVLLALGRDGDAARELAKLPPGPEGKGRAAQVYQSAGHHAEAIPLLLELLDADPGSVELRFRLGAAYERTGRVSEAASAFQTLLERSPDNSMALNYLGYMWAEKGENLPDALRMIRRAVELEPDNAAYIDSLGWVYYRLGDFAQAIEQLERAAHMLPADGTVQEHLGDALRAVGKLGEARTAYRRALALGDSDASKVQRKLEEVERDQPRQ